MAAGRHLPRWRPWKMAAGCYLGFDLTGNSTIRSTDHENPTQKPNTEWIGWPVAEMPIFPCACAFPPYLLLVEVLVTHSESRQTPISYSSLIVTTALYLA